MKVPSKLVLNELFVCFFAPTAKFLNPALVFKNKKIVLFVLCKWPQAKQNILLFNFKYRDWRYFKPSSSLRRCKADWLTRIVFSVAVPINDVGLATTSTLFGLGHWHNGHNGLPKTRQAGSDAALLLIVFGVGLVLVSMPSCQSWEYLSHCYEKQFLRTSWKEAHCAHEEAEGESWLNPCSQQHLSLDHACQKTLFLLRFSVLSGEDITSLSKTRSSWTA